MIVMPTLRAIRAAAVGAASLLLVAGCGSLPGAGASGASVVTSIYPLEFFAERIAGDDVPVSVLTSPGTEPHDLELTVRQVAEVAEAEQVVYLSGLQPAVDQAVDQADPQRVLDVAEAADLVTVEESSHHDGHEHETAGGHQVDPHFWLDPRRLADVAVAVEQRLAEADPEHAEVYARNLARLEADLDDLDSDFAAGLARCERDTVVVSHDAFGYLGQRYGLDLHAINGLSPDAEPSPAHLGELAGLIESEGITTVFSETLGTTAMADTLADELGLDTAVLDPVEGLADSTADADYLSLMRANLAALRTANGCS
jgi:zinc transport system substrate-binding protein